MDCVIVHGTTIKTSSILNSLKILVVLMLLNEPTMARKSGRIPPSEIYQDRQNNEVEKLLIELDKVLKLQFIPDSTVSFNLNENTQLFTADALSYETVQLILNYDADNAAKLLESSTNDNYVIFIGNEVCNTSNANRYDSLIKFADKIDNRTRAGIIYLTLTRHLLSTRHSIKYLLKLKDLIKNKVIYYTGVDFIIRNDARDIVTDLNSYMKTYSLDFLRSLLIDKDLIDIEVGFDVINYNYQLDDDQHESIYTDFLIEVRMRGEQLYKETFHYLEIYVIMYGSSYQHLLLHFIDIVIHKDLDDVSDNTLIDLCIKYLLFEETYKNDVPVKGILQLRSMFKHIILSSSIHSALLTNAPCIRNVGLNQYLAVNDGDLNDSERRNVYTRSSSSIDGYIQWKIKYESNKYLIFNEKFNEPLFTESSEYVESRHMVWTSITGVSGNNIYWYLEEQEEDGDYVYIKSFNYNEYLYGSFMNSDDHEMGWNNSHVYALKGGSKDCPSNECLWSIEDCDHLP